MALLLMSNTVCTKIRFEVVPRGCTIPVQMNSRSRLHHVVRLASNKVSLCRVRPSKQPPEQHQQRDVTTWTTATYTCERRPPRVRGWLFTQQQPQSISSPLACAHASTQLCPAHRLLRPNSRCGCLIKPAGSLDRCARALSRDPSRFP